MDKAIMSFLNIFIIYLLKKILCFECFTEVTVPCQESEHSYICVLWVSIMPLSTICLFVLWWTVPTACRWWTVPTACLWWTVPTASFLMNCSDSVSLMNCSDSVLVSVFHFILFYVIFYLFKNTLNLVLDL